MHAMILWAIPVDLIAAVQPGMAKGISDGMKSYLKGIPDTMWTLFGAGYLGYTAARTWAKAKRLEQ